MFSNASSIGCAYEYIGYTDHFEPVRWCSACLIRYNAGSRMLMLGDFMSIFARSTWEPSACLPSRIAAKSARFSSTERERYGADLYHTGGRPRTGQG